MTLDDTVNLWSCFCVLPQVAWWGKGHLYVFMVTALCPLLLTMQILFASVSFRRVVADLRLNFCAMLKISNSIQHLC